MFACPVTVPTLGSASNPRVGYPKQAKPSQLFTTLAPCLSHAPHHLREQRMQHLGVVVGIHLVGTGQPLANLEHAA